VVYSVFFLGLCFLLPSLSFCQSCSLLKCLTISLNDIPFIICYPVIVVFRYRVLLPLLLLEHGAELFDVGGTQLILQQLLKHCFRHNSTDPCASCVSHNSSCLASHEEAKIWKVHLVVMLTTVRLNMLMHIY